MPVTLIQNAVLFPHPPDWSTRPEWKRTWETGITPALTGAEQRQSFRALGRNELSYVISALTLEERAVLDERLDAASKSGLACAPYWGRGIPFVVAIGTNVVLGSAAWTWAIGDSIFFQKPGAQTAYVNYEVRTVTNVIPQPAGIELVINQALNLNYAPGVLAWPLLFGKFKMEQQSAITSWHGDVKITIPELIASHQAAVGNVPAPAGPGVGGWAVGSTLVVS